MKNEAVVFDEITIKDKIYVLRGEKVMLDFELAEIYGYSTKNFNRQVKNNIDKFDNDFMFQLTKEETEYLSRCKNCTLNSSQGRGHNIKYLPYAFTEQGIYMLMTVLKGELATIQSKNLVRLFKSMKDYIIENNKILLQVAQNTKDISLIKETMATKSDLANIMNNFIVPNKYKEFLIMNGETVEADICYENIYAKAKKKIYVIDNYIGLKTLIPLKSLNNVEIIIFSDNINKGLTKIEYKDFCKEYPNVNIKFIKTNNIFHDRYIILDYKLNSETIYHCGASSKDAGKKITTISEIENKDIYYQMIDELLKNESLILK